MEWFEVDDPQLSFQLTAQTAGNSNDPLAHINSSFFHGKFKKYSARLGNSGYIIKVRQEPFVDLPSMEFLCNQIARGLGLNVPDFYLIKLEGYADAFISKNFMDRYRDANLLHLYRYMGDTPFDVQNVMQVILTNTDNHLDIEQFIHLCLFDMLIGNHDRHGRNLALVQSPKAKILAPFYDNPSYLGIEEEWLLKAIHDPCGKIYTSKSTEPRMIEYVNEFCELGCFSCVHDFFRAIDYEKIETLISNSFISQKRKEAFLKLVAKRFEDLEQSVRHHASYA